MSEKYRDEWVASPPHTHQNESKDAHKHVDIDHYDDDGERDHHMTAQSYSHDGDDIASGSDEGSGGGGIISSILDALL